MKYKSCKCGSRPRIVSNVVQNIDRTMDMGERHSDECRDVCTNPICGSPQNLSILAPLIYDEVGINLCATFSPGVDIAASFPTATSATVSIVKLKYCNGKDNVSVEPIIGRQNCYLVTLSNIAVTFAVNLYDECCRYVATIYPTATYFPSDAECECFNEETNPSSVELEIFAPYGTSFDTKGTTPTPVINNIGFSLADNFVRQGINLYALPKLLDFDANRNTITVGVTFILQSLYFSGYRVKSEGKIQTPKGCIVGPEDTDCIKFVEGDLLNLAIKPLDLGEPEHEERHKKDCSEKCVNGCRNDSRNGSGLFEE